MANFHTNNLVIAASEEDMKKALRRMALNLRYNRNTTGFANSVDDIEDVREMYYLVGPYIDAYYMEVFCGAPTGTEGMQVVHAANFDDGLAVQVAVAPSGRGMSDTASVGFASYGSIYVLTVDYSTAWRPNSEDLDEFFRGLPTGNYGVAFYDADEYDGYESVNVFSGLHHGGAGISEADTPLTGVLDADVLRGQKTKEKGIRVAELADLAKMARVVATRGWTEFWDDEDDEPCDDDSESFDFLRPPAVNWRNPDPSDLKRIDEEVLKVLQKFPYFTGITGSDYEGRKENIERIIVGDELRLVSDWESPYFDPVGVEVLGPGHLSIGNLDNYYTFAPEADSGENVVIACVLPRIHAYVDEVVPLSQRHGNARHPKVVVRLEIVEGSLDDVLDEVHELLEKRTSDRSLTSGTWGGL